MRLSPGDHVINCFGRIYRHQFYLGVLVLKDTEYFISKSLANLGNTFKIKENLFELLKPSHYSFRLRPRDQVFFPVFRQDERDARPCKAIVFIRRETIKDLFKGPVRIGTNS